MDNETKQMFELILKKLDVMDKKQDVMDKKQDVMDKKQDVMDKKQDEIFEVVKAIEHSNNVHKSEIDNIQYKISHIDGLIKKIGDVIIESRSIK